MIASQLLGANGVIRKSEARDRRRRCSELRLAGRHASTEDTQYFHGHERIMSLYDCVGCRMPSPRSLRTVHNAHTCSALALTCYRRNPAREVALPAMSKRAELKVDRSEAFAKISELTGEACFNVSSPRQRLALKHVASQPQRSET